MNIEAVLRKRYTAKAYDETQSLTDAQKQVVMDLLRYSPSSVNSQPWHFFIIETPAARAQIMPAVMDTNAKKVANAALTVVFAIATELTDAHFQALLDQEQLDGRFVTPEARERADGVRRFFAGLNSTSPEQQRAWMARQAYISLGFLLLGAASLGLAASPIEGFDTEKMDVALGLKAKGLTSVVMATVGHGHDSDFNVSLPKSRLNERTVITRL